MTEKKMQNYDTDIVVIGAGPVGLFSVFQAGMLNMKCHVIDILEVCYSILGEKHTHVVEVF